MPEIFDRSGDEYLGDLNYDIALAERQRLKSLQPENIYFAWAGNQDTGYKEHYYRIQSPVFLIEYRNAGDHVHSVWRAVEDFGAALETSRR